MKILYVASKYDYGNPKRGIGPEHYNFYDTLVKMDEGKNTVIYFPLDEIMINEGREEMNKKLIGITQKEKPDILFFVNGSKKIRKEVISKITKELGFTTFNWNSDDHWKFYVYSKYWASAYSWVSTTDIDSVKKYKKIGYENVILTQWACNHYLYKPLDLPKKYDVSFVGAAHGNRKKIMRELKKAGINVRCWGTGWPAGRVSQEEMLRIWSQSKINLNFTKSSGVPWKELALVFLRRDWDRKIRLNNPLRWPDHFRTMSASLFKYQIKGRNFEIPGCKTFFLTENVKHLERYYEIGREVECFKDTKELIEKIRYYLEHEEEREKIAKAGYERTSKDHTFEKRFKDILKTIGLCQNIA